MSKQSQCQLKNGNDARKPRPVWLTPPLKEFQDGVSHDEFLSTQRTHSQYQTAQAKVMPAQLQSSSRKDFGMKVMPGKSMIQGRKAIPQTMQLHTSNIPPLRVLMLDIPKKTHMGMLSFLSILIPVVIVDL